MLFAFFFAAGYDEEKQPLEPFKVKLHLANKPDTLKVWILRAQNAGKKDIS